MSTLTELVNKTTEIKDNLITCSETLRANLKDKGIEVSNSDNMLSLINKVNDMTSGTYSVTIKVFTDITQPISPKKGDVWFPIGEPVRPILSLSQPTNAQKNDLWLGFSDYYCQVQVDNSISDYLTGVTTTFNINLKTNAIDTLPTSAYPVLENSLSSIYASFGGANFYNGISWEKPLGVKCWNGSGWDSLNSPSTLYLIQNGAFVNSDIIGTPPSTSYITQGSTEYSALPCVRIRLHDNSGWGRFWFSFGKKFNLSEYKKMYIKFAYDEGDITAKINVFETPLYNYSSATPSSYISNEQILYNGKSNSFYFESYAFDVSFTNSADYHLGFYFYCYDPNYINIQYLYLSKK